MNRAELNHYFCTLNVSPPRYPGVEDAVLGDHWALGSDGTTMLAKRAVEIIGNEGQGRSKGYAPL
jgi:hypothetical protein